MTPQESEVLEQMSSHLADLSIHLSECHADAVKTNVDFMAFPAGQVHALIMDITMSNTDSGKSAYPSPRNRWTRCMRVRSTG
jgi:hypothetical protein